MSYANHLNVKARYFTDTNNCCFIRNYQLLISLTILKKLKGEVAMRFTSHEHVTYGAPVLL